MGWMGWDGRGMGWAWVKYRAPSVLKIEQGYYQKERQKERCGTSTNSSRESFPSMFLSIWRKIFSVLFSGVDSSSGIFSTEPTWNIVIFFFLIFNILNLISIWNPNVFWPTHGIANLSSKQLMESIIGPLRWWWYPQFVLRANNGIHNLDICSFILQILGFLAWFFTYFWAFRWKLFVETLGTKYWKSVFNWCASLISTLWL